MRALRLHATHRAAQEEALKPQLFREELGSAIDRALLVQEARGAPQFTASLAAFESEIEGAGDSAVQSLAVAVLSDDKLAEAWLRQRVAVDERVAPQDVAAWYQSHRDEFRRAAEIRWERVSASPRQFGSPEAARAVLEELRHRADSPAAAAPPSVELQSLRVESFDWTSPAAMPSHELGEALRGLPVGVVSEIVEDAAGLHVARVLARRPERLLTLEEAAPQIEAQIVRQRRDGPRRAYLNALRRKAEIWTIN
jgi:parvulin-like peptidyl-prolyl isomerase